MNTQLIQHQVITKGPRFYSEGGTQYRITVQLRYDDSCRNGHNSFSLTASIDRKAGNGQWKDDAGGCLHDEIVKHFPELEPLVKWHLCSSDGPMHYIANTLYWVGKRGFVDGKPGSPPNLDHARSAAVWPGATDEQLNDPNLEAVLKGRLDTLLADFQAAMEGVGFTY